VQFIKHKTSTYFNRRAFNSNHIVYLKVHKTASCTIQNIIMRAGVKRNLSFAFPLKKNLANFGWPNKFRQNLYPHLGKEVPDVFCLHTVFSDDLVKTMPADSFYLTSLRDPFKQLTSMYQYYRLQNCKHSQDNQSHSLLEWINAGYRVCNSIIKNPQAYDLGLSLANTNNHKVIHELIHNVEKQFHFVIIVEYFDECLILLRDMLGWGDSDVLYFQSNRRRNMTSSTKNEALLPEDNEKNRAIVYKFLSADFSLYCYFKKKLETIIARKKDYLAGEVLRLKELRTSWKKLCIKESLPAFKIKDFRFRPYGNSQGYLLTDFGLNNSMCINMALSEIAHIRKIYESQGG